MKNFKLRFMAAVFCLLGVSEVGAQTNPPFTNLCEIQNTINSRGKAARQIGKYMNGAEKYLEKFGSIHVSVPAISRLGENFDFDLKQGGTNYYNDAKTQVQGALANFQQSIQSLSVQGQVQADPTVATAYAAQLSQYFSSMQRVNTKQNLFDQAAQQQLQASIGAANTNTDPSAKNSAVAQAMDTYAQQYSAPSNAPNFPTASSTNSPSVPTIPGRPNVTNVLNSQSFSPFQGLLGGLNVTPTVSDRSAIITAAGDVATESIFRHFMGNTNTAQEAAEDNVYFGFSTVSVDPGWRTSKGWAAEDVMTAELSYDHEARLEVVQRVFGKMTNVATRAALYLTYGAELFTNADPISWKLARDYYRTRYPNYQLQVGDISDFTHFLEKLALHLQSPYGWLYARLNEKSKKSVDYALTNQNPSLSSAQLAAAIAKPQELTDMIASYLSKNSSILAKDYAEMSTNNTAVEEYLVQQINEIITGPLLNEETTFKSTNTNLADVNSFNKQWTRNETNDCQSGWERARSNYLLLRKYFPEFPCFDTSVTFPEFLKTYTYTTTISNVVITNAVATNISTNITFNYIPLTNNPPLRSDFNLTIPTTNASDLIYKIGSIWSNQPNPNIRRVGSSVDDKLKTFQAISGNEMSVDNDDAASAVAEILHDRKINFDDFKNFHQVALGHYISNYLRKDTITNKVVHQALNTVPADFAQFYCEPSPVPVPVTIISPLVDADVLDSSSSSRNQTEFALAMSFALRYIGLAGQASAYEQFVKQVQTDVRTRTPKPAINAFSGTDGKFGFQIGPRFEASGKPGDSGSPLENILARQSFPALLLLRLGAADLRVAFKTNHLAEGNLTIVEPRLRFTETRRWTPLKRSLNWFLDGAFNWLTWKDKNETESARTTEAAALNNAFLFLTNSYNHMFTTVASNAIYKRIENLESQIVGGEGGMFLAMNDIVPQDNPSVVTAITNVVPEFIDCLRQSNEITLAYFGSNLKQVQIQTNQIIPFASILSNAATVTGIKAKLAGDTLLITCDVLLYTNTVLVFQLNTSNKVTLFTPPVPLNITNILQTNAPVMSFAMGDPSNPSFAYKVQFTTNLSEAEAKLGTELIQTHVDKDKPTLEMGNNTVMSVLQKPEAKPSPGNNHGPKLKAKVELKSK